MASEARIQQLNGVLITGCSSGIGRATAVQLAARGFTVFATVRKEADAENLRSLNIPNLVPVCPVDLTNLDHIANSAKIVSEELNRRGKKGLYALINNAGGGAPAPVELMQLDQFHRELQTRILGSVAMIQTFLPLIRQAGGRIVWIMTPAMIPTPYVASIHACDFALNCVARTLDIELKPWRIPNIMIRCGGIKTPLRIGAARMVERHGEIRREAHGRGKSRGDSSQGPFREAAQETVLDRLYGRGRAFPRTHTAIVRRLDSQKAILINYKLSSRA